MVDFSKRLSGSDVRAFVFARSPHVVRGYVMADVDLFLDRCAAGLDGTGVAVSAAETRGIRFRTTRPGENGYAESEVDAALDRLEAEFARRFGSPRD